MVKRYRTEAGTPVVNGLFAERMPDEIFATCQLIGIEIESFAARVLGLAEMSRAGRGTLLRAFAGDLEKLTVVPLSGRLATEAARCAREFGLRTLDAMRLAVAFQAAPIPSDLVFVTSDRALLRAAQVAGFVPLDPTRPDARERVRELRA